MSDLAPPSQSDFIRTMQELHAAILAAETDGTRLQAERDLAEFIQAHTQGKARQWVDARARQANDA